MPDFDSGHPRSNRGRTLFTFFSFFFPIFFYLYQLLIDIKCFFLIIVKLLDFTFSFKKHFPYNLTALIAVSQSLYNIPPLIFFYQ